MGIYWKKECYYFLHLLYLSLWIINSRLSLALNKATMCSEGVEKGGGGDGGVEREEKKG